MKSLTKSLTPSKGKNIVIISKVGLKYLLDIKTFIENTYTNAI